MGVTWGGAAQPVRGPPASKGEGAQAQGRHGGCAGTEPASVPGPQGWTGRPCPPPCPPLTTFALSLGQGHTSVPKVSLWLLKLPGRASREGPCPWPWRPRSAAPRRGRRQGFWQVTVDPLGWVGCCVHTSLARTGPSNPAAEHCHLTVLQERYGDSCKAVRKSRHREVESPTHGCTASGAARIQIRTRCSQSHRQRGSDSEALSPVLIQQAGMPLADLEGRGRGPCCPGSGLAWACVPHTLCPREDRTGRACSGPMGRCTREARCLQASVWLRPSVWTWVSGLPASLLLLCPPPASDRLCPVTGLEMARRLFPARLCRSSEAFWSGLICSAFIRGLPDLSHEGLEPGTPQASCCLPSGRGPPTLAGGRAGRAEPAAGRGKGSPREGLLGRSPLLPRAERLSPRFWEEGTKGGVRLPILGECSPPRLWAGDPLPGPPAPTASGHQLLLILSVPGSVSPLPGRPPSLP